MNQTTEIRKYELMLILAGDVTEAEHEKELAEAKKIINESTKGITYEDSWGCRELSYKIKKHTRGYYVVFNFNASPDQIAELKTAIGLSPFVVRSMLTSVPENYNPDQYKTYKLVESEPRDREEAKVQEALIKSQEREAEVEVPRERKPKLAGQAEVEHLKKVEKKLEEILENPDIKIN